MATLSQKIGRREEGIEGEREVRPVEARGRFMYPLPLAAKQEEKCETSPLGPLRNLSNSQEMQLWSEADEVLPSVLRTCPQWPQDNTAHFYTDLEAGAEPEGLHWKSQGWSSQGYGTDTCVYSRASSVQERSSCSRCTDPDRSHPGAHHCRAWCSPQLGPQQW